MWRRRVEVGVVVGVIALVMAVILPAIERAREVARLSQSKNNLKQLGLALHNYHDTFLCLPPGGTFHSDGRGHHGWMSSTLPYMDSSPVYSWIDFNEPWDSPRNAGIFTQSKTVYESPSTDTPVGKWDFCLAHYSANANLLAANSSVQLKDVPSLENIFLAGELAGDFVPWGCPYNWRPLVSVNGTPPTYGRSRKDGCLFLLADGHVEFISNAVAPELVSQLAGPDLAGFAKTPDNIVRPAAFVVPRDALKRSNRRVRGEWFCFCDEDIHGHVVGLFSHDKREWSVSDSDFSSIVRHVHLERLELGGSFTDAALPSLGGLTKLRTLRLHSDGITESGLSFVEHLPNLKTFTIRGKQITNDIRQRLRERLPTCEIWLHQQ